MKQRRRQKTTQKRRQLSRTGSNIWEGGRQCENTFVDIITLSFLLQAVFVVNLQEAKRKAAEAKHLC